MNFTKINTINQIENGRVINIDNEERPSFPLYHASSKKDGKWFKCSALSGIQEKSPLSLMYFSKENIERLQNLIRYTVFTKSNGKYKVDNQSEIDLKIVMRSLYLQHSPNLECHIIKQVEFLNNLVVNWCYPKIINEVRQYIGYVKDVERLPVPLEHPQNLSSAGTKTLKSVTSTF
tara:strand:+ start:26 stop:553 length:528 start_codon:yes stop_codon:yes gene_type:complete